MPGWAYGKTISNDLEYLKEKKIDRCINCGQSKPVKTRITMEFVKAIIAQARYA